MFSGVWWGDEEDKDEGDQDAYPYEQQGISDAPQQTQDAGLQQGGNFAQEALLALWDQGTGGSASSSGPGATAGGQAGGQAAPQDARRAQTSTSSAQQQEDREKEDEDERRERRALEERENFAKQALAKVKLETIGEASDYCESLVAKQLERAERAAPTMNESIYGDGHARKAITTLLPDELIRNLFLKTTRNQKAWPRLRPLFGTPPYNFLRPEDAGLVRAAGMSAGRTNMTYERAGETAAYSQFGSGHLVDEFLREYRLLPSSAPSSVDSLPFDMKSVEASQAVLMNVRVPKRSREEKVSLLKDQSKRRAVVFPYVGELLKVRYSTGLKRVWGEKAEDDTVSTFVVKRMVPRSVNGATAAIVGVKVF